MQAFVWAIYSFILYAFILTRKQHMISDADTGWHIRAGDKIVDGATIPKFDDFSYTSTDYVWYNLSWGYDALLSLAHNMGNLYLPIVITTIITAVSLMLVAKNCVKASDSIIASYIAVILGSIAIASSISVRPHVVSFLFAILFFNILSSRRRLVYLPLLMLLWVNLHGGFIVGFVIIGAFMGQELLAKKISNFLVLLACLVVTFLASIINPYFIDAYDGVYRTLGGPLKQGISEWRPLDLGPEAIYMVAAVISLGFARVKLFTATMALIIAWGAYSIMHIRGVGYFAIFSAPIIAAALARVFKDKDLLQQLDKSYADVFVKYLALVSTIMFVLLPVFFDAKAEFDKDKHPVKAIEYIKRNHADKNMFNSYGYGGHIIYAAPGKLKTFIDGRAETAFKPSLVEDYISLHHGKDIKQIFTKYKISLVFLHKDTYKPIQQYMADANWQLGYSDGDSLVYFDDTSGKKN